MREEGGVCHSNMIGIGAKKKRNWEYVDARLKLKSVSGG